MGNSRPIGVSVDNFWQLPVQVGFAVFKANHSGISSSPLTQDNLSAENYWICVFWDLFVSLILRGAQVLHFILLSPFVYIWWKVHLEVFDVFIIDRNRYNPLVSLFSLEHRLATSCWSTRCGSVKLSWQVLWWWHGSVAKARKLVWTWSWLLENYRAMLIKACHITNRLHLHNACVCVSTGRRHRRYLLSENVIVNYFNLVRNPSISAPG